MNAGAWLKLVLILGGLSLGWMTLVSLAKRKFTDGFCMLWGLIAVCMIIGGIFLQPAGITNYISNMGLVLVVLIAAGVLLMGWAMSSQISSLTRKNHELAMQVSLLNQEHDKIQRMLEELTGKKGNEVWR